ncbi:peroxiredoxin [Rhodobacterales bacterium 52_120_T64]|nr:peroxiredoxin [Rhodobacterales bacterium 52_120_T64]
MQVGDHFPDFTLPRDGEGAMSLADFKGQKLVLFLYPKDDTSGCTLESIEFTECSDKFTTVGAVVVGLSKDSVTSHDKFIKKHNLNMPLLSDETGELLETLGCWVEKNMYGRTFMGIERTTFLIDETGIIRQIWNKVRVKGHVESVLKAVKSL